MTAHRVLSVSFLVALATACGGGGPGVSGPEALTLFADYSGSWVLDTLASDGPLAERGAERAGAAEAGGGSRDPFGGSSQPERGRSAPPGGMSGGARGGSPDGGGGRGPQGRGGARPQNPEAMQATMAIARLRPSRMTLELTDSLFSVVQSPGGRASAPMNGDEVELNRSAWPTKVKVTWDDRQPRIERALEDGGRVTDHFELVSRTRLLVTRTVEGGPRGDIELHFSYDRATSSPEPDR